MPNENESDRDLHAGQPAEGGLTPPLLGRGPGYEVRDTKVGAVATFTVGLFLSLIVAQVALWGLLKAISGDTPEPPSELAPPDVILEQRRQLDAKEEAALKSIDRAIETIAEKGLPAPAGKPRTEVDVNSHSGTAVPAETKEKENDKAKTGGEAKP